jgi:phosphoribosylformimino-5-aminoimidazole carboxamide ribotide isomerase
MILYPAVDILGGRSVRLYKGDKNAVTDYGDPVEIACRWRDEGAEYLHVVDLDGAFTGEQKNLKVVEAIAKAAGIPMQLGGGIRDTDAVRRALGAGVSRVIIGTALYTNPYFLEKVVKEYGAGRVAVGIDTKDGLLAIKGWVEKSTVTAEEMAKHAKHCGINTAVFTDISRDGALTGVNIPLTVEIKKKSGLNIIASGGLSSLDEIRELATAGIDGCILGKAIFEGKFTIREALNASKDL